MNQKHNIEKANTHTHTHTQQQQHQQSNEKRSEKYQNKIAKTKGVIIMIA